MENCWGGRPGKTSWEVCGLLVQALVTCCGCAVSQGQHRERITKENELRRGKKRRERGGLHL